MTTPRVTEVPISHGTAPRHVVTLGAFGFHVIDRETGDSMAGEGCRYMGALPVFAARFRAQLAADALNSH